MLYYRKVKVFSRLGADMKKIGKMIFGGLGRIDRMTEAPNLEPGAKPERLLEVVKEQVDIFVGEAPQFDDLTMLSITYNGSTER